ncbi:sugar kinase [Vibrio cionasavignyae]|uniref:sugar kinase n=1 Tax=Vibrio cionasavignyae TaxID=2910252 RepID=UPI003D0D7B52
MKHIAILGECMIELNGKPFGEMHQTFGGDTLNAAVYLTRSCALNAKLRDIKVSYVSALGTDSISDGMLSRWQEEGIHTELVLRDNQRTPGLYLIQLDDAGERTFLYWRNQSAARYLLQHPNFKAIETQLMNVDMVFVSGISLAILSLQDRQALLALLTRLQTHGIEIAFDSNYRPALWPSDNLETVKTDYQAMYQITNLALVTFDDEQLIWGDVSPQDTLSRLHQLGVNKVVVKLGKDGCLVGDRTQNETYSVTTTPVSRVVDTTSAGDSFNGGFLSCYLAGGSLKQSCQRGNALAGVVIQHRGAIIPTDATDTVTKI